MKVIVIANIAGGVGKTTAAHAIAVASVEYGKKVLLIDADPAAALTFCCGIENPRITTLEFLTEQYSIAIKPINQLHQNLMDQLCVELVVHHLNADHLGL